jgi:hypothetical protein
MRKRSEAAAGNIRSQCRDNENQRSQFAKVGPGAFQSAMITVDGFLNFRSRTEKIFEK